MGVEHALICKKCKTWIDLHKCYATQMVCDRFEPYSPHSKEHIESYWGMRAFWYLWKHKGHGGEVEWSFDTEDSYWEMQLEFTEEASHDVAWQRGEKKE